MGKTNVGKDQRFVSANPRSLSLSSIHLSATVHVFTKQALFGLSSSMIKYNHYLQIS